MSEPFRFRPPTLRAPDELHWALTRAFAAPGAEAGRPPAAAAVELARRLALLPRIALRTPDARLELELGAEGLDAVRRARSLALARELRFDETIAAVGRAAARCGVAPLLLKGRALTQLGRATRGARPSADLDLLVPEPALGALRDELVAAGFEPAASGAYEHQLAPLRHPAGETVELHRHLPGVRIEGRRFASWSDVERAGLSVATGAGPEPSALRLPRRPLLIAHALVHALAQHAFTARFPGWLLIADLIDLDAGGESPAPDGEPWRAWIAGELSRREIDAALELAARAAAGAVRHEGDDDAALLARHASASALDSGYGEALKARWLERPLTERSRARARLALVARTFVPSHRSASVRESGARRLARWLARPFVLARKAARVVLAARRVGPPPS